MNNNLTEQILVMKKADQDARFASKPGPTTETNYTVYLLDAVHNYWLHKIINDFGYPTNPLIGEEAMNAFWLLIQHQDYDLKLQEEVLENCDFSPTDEAMLTDRVLVNKGEEQMYGTQFFRQQDGSFAPRPIKDPASVNERRKKVGLGTLEENTESIKKLNQR